MYFPRSLRSATPDRLLRRDETPPVSHGWRRRFGGTANSTARTTAASAWYRTFRIGIKDLAAEGVAAQCVPSTASDNALTVYCENTDWIAKVYTEESAIYGGFDNCSTGDYWLGRHGRDIDLHKSGIERIWAILEPGHTGVYH